MKFTKHEMVRLVPRAVADYLQTNGWSHNRDVEGKGAIWLYRDEDGDEYDIMLPTNLNVGDYAIRMGEAIFVLGQLEERDVREVYFTLVETKALPSEIFESEIAAQEGLEWNASEKAKLEKLMEALDENCVDAPRQRFFHCLGEIAETFARGTAMTGDDWPKTLAVWQSCQRIILVAGWTVKDTASETEFWSAAQASQMDLWFDNNVHESPSNSPHDRVSSQD